MRRFGDLIELQTREAGQDRKAEKGEGRAEKREAKNRNRKTEKRKAEKELRKTAKRKPEKEHRKTEKRERREAEKRKRLARFSEKSVAFELAGQTLEEQEVCSI